MIAVQSVQAEYGEDYLAFKHWGRETFGQYTDGEARYFYQKILSHCRGIEGRVLEIGFGNGAFLGFARAKGLSAAGVEANLLLVERARDAGFSVFRDLDEITGGEAYDLIVMLDVLEHLSHEQIEHSMRKIRRLLSADGVLVARFPNGDSPFGRIHQNGDVTHTSTLGKGKVEQYCKLSGLQIVSLGNASSPIEGGMLKRGKRALKDAAQSAIESVFSAIFYHERIAFGSNYMLVATKAGIGG